MQILYVLYLGCAQTPSPPRKSKISKYPWPGAKANQKYWKHLDLSWICQVCVFHFTDFHGPMAVSLQKCRKFEFSKNRIDLKKIFENQKNDFEFNYTYWLFPACVESAQNKQVSVWCKIGVSKWPWISSLRRIGFFLDFDFHHTGYFQRAWKVPKINKFPSDVK